MNPKKIWANLAVKDLERTTIFYSSLGFTHNGQSNELTSFLIGDDKFIMHFFLRKSIKKNMKVKFIDEKNVIEVMFTLAAESKEQIKKWAKEVENAGGKIITKPSNLGKNYYGFTFSDPDGHTFNAFYMG